MWPFNKKKDLVVVTIVSYDNQEKLVKQLQEGLEKAWSDKKVAVFSCTNGERIDIQVFKE
jgi:hypothetical protein